MIQDLRKRTPLHYCFVKFNKEERDSFDNTSIDPFESVSSICALEGLDINVSDDTGKTALHYCAIRNSVMSARYLIRNKVNLEAEDEFGNTPLTLAFLNKHSEIATLLIEQKANLKVRAIVKNK